MLTIQHIYNEFQTTEIQTLLKSKQKSVRNLAKFGFQSFTVKFLVVNTIKNKPIEVYKVKSELWIVGRFRL